jgi:hypothetical protein
MIDTHRHRHGNTLLVLARGHLHEPTRRPPQQQPKPAGAHGQQRIQKANQCHANRIRSIDTAV